MAALRALALGNQRHVKGMPKPVSNRRAAPFAAVVCPAGWRLSPEALFDASPSELYIAQGDVEGDCHDVIASLEWAAAALGIRVVVILGDFPARAEIELQMAPFDLRFVRAVVGPNQVIRFEPARFEEAPPQIGRSTKTVQNVRPRPGE
jgi:carbonic anhydrase